MVEASNARVGSQSNAPVHSRNLQLRLMRNQPHTVPPQIWVRLSADFLRSEPYQTVIDPSFSYEGDLSTGVRSWIHQHVLPFLWFVGRLMCGKFLLRLCRLRRLKVSGSRLGWLSATRATERRPLFSEH